jgi:ProP effector
MSNGSLKEQLQALTTVSTSEPNAKVQPQQSAPLHAPKQAERARPTHKSAHQKPQPKKQKPSWLESAQYGVELLKAYFPQCFKELKEVQPLKIGIKQDLVKFLSTREEIVIGDKACMVNSLSYYVNSVAYHKNMVAGAMRIDLEGNQAGPVSEEEANYSAECQKSKLEKKASNVAIKA